jgi:hypothetical protein
MKDVSPLEAVIHKWRRLIPYVTYDHGEFIRRRNSYVFWRDHRARRSAARASATGR